MNAEGWLAVIGFILLGLVVIPFDKLLERRRARRRNQARPWRRLR